jgi:hypothetical protein
MNLSPAAPSRSQFCSRRYHISAVGRSNIFTNADFFGPPLVLSFVGLLYQPWMIECDDCGAINGMDELNIFTL